MSSLQRIIDINPITFGGLAFGMSSAAAFWLLGVGRTDHIFVVLGGAGLAIWLLGLLLTVLAAVYIGQLEVKQTSRAAVLKVDVWQSTGYVHRLPWWLPLVQLKWQWQGSEWRCRHTKGVEQIWAHRRGEWSQIVRRLSIQDAFGLSQIVLSRTQSIELRALPNTDTIPAPPVVFGLQTGADLSHPSGKPRGDRIDLRRYVYGDPVRHILWKVYARTGELMVRTPEHAVQTSNRMVAFLVLSSEDSCAAALASVALRSDSLGEDWRFGCDCATSPIKDEASAQEIIVQSGSENEHLDGSGLAEFLDHAIEGHRPSLLVFAPPVNGKWLKHVLNERFRADITVIIGVDLIAAPGLKQKARAWAFRPDVSAIENRAVALTDLQEMAAQLSSAGIGCRVFDRQSKRTFMAAEILHRSINYQGQVIGE